MTTWAALAVFDSNGKPLPSFANDIRAYEGGVETPQLWVIADGARSEQDAVSSLVAIQTTMRARARVSLVARKLAEQASPSWSREAVQYLMPLGYAVPAEETADLDSWYAHEHVELLLRCRDWLRVRRFEVVDAAGTGWTRLVLHDLARADVLTSPEVRAAMATPWRRRLAETPWFLAEPRAPLAVRQ